MSRSTSEASIQALGHALFAKVKARKQSAAAGWWKSKLMDYALEDEKLKIQLFRFVDVLPALKDNEQVARHLNEYFTGQSRTFSSFMGWGAALAGRTSLGGALAAGQIRKQVEGMAHTFICAGDAASAAQAVTAMRRKHLAATFDLLGEAVVSEAEADEYLRKYLDLLATLVEAEKQWGPDPQLDRSDTGPLPRINLSIKLSSLCSQLEPADPQGSSAAVLPRLNVLAERALAAGAFLNVDMEDYRVKDLTLDVFKRLCSAPKFAAYPHFGIVLQAYLKDTQHDLAELAKWAKKRGVRVTVRLVKGAYWDYEVIHARQHSWPVPVFESKHETDAEFERCSRQLFEAAPYLDAAFGTHNVRSIAAALAHAETLKRPKNSFEIQGLYGMADPIKESLAEDGYRVRVYAPFGDLLPGMAYLVRRLLENTANESFLKQGFVQGVSAEKLLADPASIAAAEHALADDKRSASRRMAPAARTFTNEPELSFLGAAERERMTAALAAVRRNFGAHWPLVIGGKRVEGEAGRLLSANPSRREEIIGSVAKGSEAQADAAVAAALAAFPAWRDRPVSERAAILRKAAALMRERKFELIALEVFEAGKPWRESDGDVAEAIDFLEYYALEAERLMAPRRALQVPAEANEYFYQPRGVAAIIAPWNFPLAILTGMTAAALVTGNTVIIKPAEATSIIGAQLMQILSEAGVPAGAANFFPCEGRTAGARLVTHPHVHLIAFTGGVGTGQWILAEAAKTREGQTSVKRVICEMGGKNAIVVDEDADLDEAVLGVLQSAFGYAGQKCSACSRAIVVGTAYEPFLKRLLPAAQSLRIAPAEDPGCRVSPVIDDNALRKILDYIEIGRKEATLALAVDAGELARKGSFVGPHIFRDVSPKARIAQEEIFGPVLSVMQAVDFGDALRSAEDVPYALTGGVYSRSPANIERARREFRVGNLYINRGTTGAKVARQPFGGFKMSGIGSKAGGPDYLLQFLEPRTVTENTLRRGFAEDPE